MAAAAHRLSLPAPEQPTKHVATARAAPDATPGPHKQAAGRLWLEPGAEHAVGGGEEPSPAASAPSSPHDAPLWSLATPAPATPTAATPTAAAAEAPSVALFEPMIAATLNTQSPLVRGLVGAAPERGSKALAQRLVPRAPPPAERADGTAVATAAAAAAAAQAPLAVAAATAMAAAVAESGAIEAADDLQLAEELASLSLRLADAMAEDAARQRYASARACIDRLASEAPPAAAAAAAGCGAEQRMQWLALAAVCALALVQLQLALAAAAVAPVMLRAFATPKMMGAQREPAAATAEQSLQQSTEEETETEEEEDAQEAATSQSAVAAARSTAVDAEEDASEKTSTPSNPLILRCAERMR
jgi:hypothetical protein